MAGDVYRFLLRMPTHLRERLTDATAESGRSLNAEIVNRLEESLAERPWRLPPPGSADIRRLEGDWGADNPREEEHVTNKNSRRATRRRRLVFGSRSLAAVVLTAALVVGASCSTRRLRRPRRRSPRRARALTGDAAEAREPASSRRASRSARAAKSGDGDLEWQMHATPGTEIPLAAITGSRADWKALKARGQRRAKLGDHGMLDEPGPGQRGLPAEPVPQPLRLRPERVRRRGPDVAQRHRPELRRVELPLLDRERGRRYLADGQRSFAAQAEVGVRLRGVPAQQHRGARARSRTTRRAT